MPHEKAVQIMTNGRGSHFDADMFDAFVDIQEEFRTIALRFVDSDADMNKKKDYLAQAIAV
jgi:putative two-component system response regulator